MAVVKRENASTSLDATGSAQPTLLIVMGTSGCGKSTVGMALSQALHCPFVDGDDLHPASNVEKMSKGQPLNDQDREPWLKTIRQTGLSLCHKEQDGNSQPQNVKEGGDKDVRRLAEVYETSQHPSSSAAAAHDVDQSTHPDTDQTNSTEPHPQPTNTLAVIACSSLKIKYRQLLRGSIHSLDETISTDQETVPSDLKVIHIYLKLSKHLLEERMANRKGHFMKLEMLYSQIDTLQPPNPDSEPNIIVVDVQAYTTTEQVITSIKTQLSHVGVI